MPRWTDSDRTPLAQMRVHAGFSREEAANILGIVMMTLYRYEIGKNDIPLGIVENMVSLYRVKFDDFRIAAKNTKEMYGNNSAGRINKKCNQSVAQKQEADCHD